MGKTGGPRSRLRPMPAGVRGFASFSGDEPPTRRHELLRWWGSESFVQIKREEKMMVIGHNPSAAGSIWNDPTTMTLMGITRIIGLRMLSIRNLSDWIATEPKDLKKLQPRDLASPDNMRKLVSSALGYGIVVAAWGNVEGRMAELAEECIISCKIAGVELHCFGINDTGHPRHPLYLPLQSKPYLWRK